MCACVGTPATLILAVNVRMNGPLAELGMPTWSFNSARASVGAGSRSHSTVKRGDSRTTRIFKKQKRHLKGVPVDPHGRDS